MENAKDMQVVHPYMDESLDLEARVDDLLGRLTFKEKCMLCAGEGNNSPPEIERLAIPRFGMTDGPHGVSPYKSGVGPDGVEMAEGSTGTSTYFPTGIQMASTWNPALIQKFGRALGEETRAVRRSMQLGPAMNICRNPMNGRTFEYFSEDPLLSGKMGAAAVKGLQSVRVAPCVKHYVANNFETNRFKVNAVIDRRTLEEIYFKGFKIVVEEADPWGVMSSYNKINGVYVSEHVEILKQVLKEEWGFSGVVVSDWGATRRCTGIAPLVEAGLDIEMGSREMYDIDEMARMKESGEFPENAFDDNVRRILRAMFRVGLFDNPSKLPAGEINTTEHQQLARKIAEEGMVLLKNEGNLLPLDPEKVKKIAITGKHADIKFGRKKLGGGSSAVFPPYEITVREGLTKRCDEAGIEVVEDLAGADAVVACIGLEHTHDFKGGDHEGSDRLRYGMARTQKKLIKAILKENKNLVLVLVNGSPFGIEPVVGVIPAILEAWYGGMERGNAVASILFGDVNPSGKLPVSWPKKKKDINTSMPLLTTIIGKIGEVRYEEGVFIGYRYHDTHEGHLRFCFGHGLSYTAFEYGGLEVSKTTMKENEEIEVSCTIKNAGDRGGAEIAQLYIHDVSSTVPRPEKELKGFSRVYLEPGQESTVTFKITIQDLSFFDESTGSWKAEPGEFKVLIGASCQDIKLKATFSLE